jgi:hypothetical protein
LEWIGGAILAFVSSLAARVAGRFVAIPDGQTESVGTRINADKYEK